VFPRKPCGSRPSSARQRVSVAPTAMARFETERSYVMIKPDGVQRGLVGGIISRFESKGFVLKALKLFQGPQSLAEEHYKARRGAGYVDGGSLCHCNHRICPASLSSRTWWPTYAQVPWSPWRVPAADAAVPAALATDAPIRSCCS